MSEPRYLTKSKFKLAMECPTKLFYAGKADYADRSLDDPFLKELGRGGFQVNALAKFYFPEGVEISARNHDEAVRETSEFLKADTVTIFEAAFRFENFFIRADIVEKRGSEIDLIEVKAKSCDETGLLNKNGTIKKEFKTHVEDVAFQKYVVCNALGTNFHVSAFLMLTDKSVLCPTDGLNQKFRLGERNVVKIMSEIEAADLDPPILRKINVDTICETVYQALYGSEEMSFEQRIAMFADFYSRDEKYVSHPSSVCKKCKFRLAAGEIEGEFKSGFHECWRNSLGWTDDDFNAGSVLDIWNFKRADKLINAKKIRLSEILLEDISPMTDKKPGLSYSERQWKQVQKAQNADISIWLDKENLKLEINKWKTPYHFIDFETCSPAIPFKKNRRPFEVLAFQFSHHTIDENGIIEHKGEFLSAAPGVFPNYDFVRELKSQLENDSGSIFRYHDFENTVLNAIRAQLLADQDDIPDRDELCEFIMSITKSTGKAEEVWTGERNMIDLHELVRRFYYDPATKGSNSIKDVLPAILNSSEFLQKKYSEPIYGAADGIKSGNFPDWRWVEFDGDKVRDPYKLLPKLFPDKSALENEILISELDVIQDGGAAMTAYGKLQFQEMSVYERAEIEAALRKYCELDTLAMVMLYEGWREMISGK